MSVQTVQCVNATLRCRSQFKFPCIRVSDCKAWYHDKHILPRFAVCHTCWRKFEYRERQRTASTPRRRTVWTLLRKLSRSWSASKVFQIYFQLLNQHQSNFLVVVHSEVSKMYISTPKNKLISRCLIKHREKKSGSSRTNGVPWTINIKSSTTTMSFEVISHFQIEIDCNFWF